MMLIEEDENNEKEIRKKKNRVIYKHFDIYINGAKTKIANYFVKDYEHLGRKGKILRLISKFEIDISERENVRLQINYKDDIIDIYGDYCFGVFGNGVKEVSYWIK